MFTEVIIQKYCSICQREVAVKEIHCVDPSRTCQIMAEVFAMECLSEEPCQYKEQVANCPLFKECVQKKGF